MKRKIHEIHYQTLKVKYPRALMVKTDTDSLLYYVKTNDINTEFKVEPATQIEIELSNYPKIHLPHNCD